MGDFSRRLPTAVLGVQNGYSTIYIKNPEEIQLAAVKQNTYAVRDINNTSIEVQLAAVRQNGHAIRHIENPSEEVQVSAIRQDSYAIQYIENPSEEVQIADQCERFNYFKSIRFEAANGR